MPAGCDFVCKNEECQHYDTGFTMTAPWPMGKIDNVISQFRVKEMPEFQEQLKKLKENGREYVCIAFPNDEELEIEGYRITLWSLGAKCLWNYHIVLEDGQTLEDAILSYKERGELPEKCPQTKSDILDYTNAIKNGINCPYCNEELFQQRWYSQEK